jgi:acyl-CoA thioesterase FadM
MTYELVKDGEIYATANTVHVCVNPKGYVKQELPEEFRKRLEAYSS